MNEIIDQETGEVRTSPLDVSRATPDLFAALAKAQAAVETVGKDGKNRDKHYSYATADSMIRGARAARAGSGLSLLTSWTYVELDPPEDTSSGQWPGAVVTLHYVLAHEGGGVVTGQLSMHAICSRGRPIDKAVASAATYAEGFVERNLMRLDRQEESKDDVERRGDEEATAPARPRPQVQPRPSGPSLGAVLEAFAAASSLEAYKAAQGLAEQAWKALSKPERDRVLAAQSEAKPRCRAPKAEVPADEAAPSNGTGATSEAAQ